MARYLFRVLSTLPPTGRAGEPATLVEEFKVECDAAIEWVRKHSAELAARCSSRAACALWIEEVP